MKKTDFENFKLSLNISIDIDTSLRRITEKIKLLSQLRDNTSLEYVADFLRSTDYDIDQIIENHVIEKNE